MNGMKMGHFWKTDSRSSSEVPSYTCRRPPTAYEHLPSTMCGSPENLLRPSLASTARPDLLTATQSSDSRTNFKFSRGLDRPTSHFTRSPDSVTQLKWSPVPAFDGPTFDSSSSRSPSDSSSWSSRLEDSETPRSSGYSTFSCASSPSRLCLNGTTVGSLPFYHSVRCGWEPSVINPSATTCYPEPPAITIIISEADIVPTYSVDEALAEFRALGHDSSFEPNPVSTESCARHRSLRKKCGDPSCRKCASKGSRKKSSVRCVFCATNGEEDVEHMFKNASGQVVCPVLSAFTCKLCGASGGNAHTFKYCPKNPFSRGNPVAAGLPPGIPFFLADKRVRQTPGAN